MAMNVKITEVRPRKHYFWIFGLSILILIGIVLTHYDMTSEVKISSLSIDPLSKSNQYSATNKSSISEEETLRYTSSIVRAHRDGSVSTERITKEKTKVRKYNGTNRTADNTIVLSGNSSSISKVEKHKLEEVHYVVFAKVHKAASSVIQNMFLRFGLTKNLNVLLPVHGHLLSESSSWINKKAILPLPKGEHYNILCNHVIFNKQQSERFFPKSTKYVGIIRHPMRQLSSALYYYATRYKKSNYPMVYRLYPDNPILGFLTRPLAYDRDRPKNSFVNNRMSIDLGFPVSDYFEYDKQNKAKIDRFIQELDKTFDLILIVELFDESLILLRRLLHWTTQDILYMKLNVRSESDKMKVKDREKALHQRWAPIDYALYGFFRNKLEKEIVRQGEDFQKEIASYKRIQRKAVNFCESGISPNMTKLTVKRTKWSTGFEVTKKLCSFMSEGETSMVAKVKQKQKWRLGLH